MGGPRPEVLPIFDVVCYTGAITATEGTNRADDFSYTKLLNGYAFNPSQSEVGSMQVATTEPKDPTVGILRALEEQPALQGDTVLATQNYYGHDDVVIKFIEAYPHVAGILCEAIPHINQVFGDSPVFRFEAYNSIDVLRVFIRTNAGIDESFELLDELGIRWWDNAYDRAEGALLFDVDPIDAV